MNLYFLCMSLYFLCMVMFSLVIQDWFSLCFAIMRKFSFCLVIQARVVRFGYIGTRHAVCYTCSVSLYRFCSSIIQVLFGLLSDQSN
jgi:hypothetical protein